MRADYERLQHRSPPLLASISPVLSRYNRRRFNGNRFAFNPFLVSRPMNEFIIEKIGLIDRGCDGSSEYLLVTNPDDETTTGQVIDYLLPLYYRDTNCAGGYFCHRITATHYPHSLSKVIAIVHHEYNN